MKSKHFNLTQLSKKKQRNTLLKTDVTSTAVKERMTISRLRGGVVHPHPLSTESVWTHANEVTTPLPFLNDRSQLWLWVISSMYVDCGLSIRVLTYFSLQIKVQYILSYIEKKKGKIL